MVTTVIGVQPPNASGMCDAMVMAGACGGLVTTGACAHAAEVSSDLGEPFPTLAAVIREAEESPAVMASGRTLPRF